MYTIANRQERQERLVQERNELLASLSLYTRGGNCEVCSTSYWIRLGQPQTLEEIHEAIRWWNNTEGTCPACILSRPPGGIIGWWAGERRYAMPWTTVGEIKLDAKDVLKQGILVVKLSRLKQWQVRLTIAKWLIALAAWVAWLDIEFVEPDDA